MWYFRLKSIDILLANYAAPGLQEEPDPTTDCILNFLAPQLKKGLQGYVTPSEIKWLQDKVEYLSNAQCLKLIKSMLNFIMQLLQKEFNMIGQCFT